MMQHYRAPTRLLDWTTSPYAAYFAVEDRWSVDGAVWGFTILDVEQGMDKLYGAAPISDPRRLPTLFQDQASPPHVQMIARGLNTDRMIAQRGKFTVCRQPLHDHARPIEAALATAPTKCVKIIIPHSRKQEFLKRLRAMNITANALFPGIDGVGRSVSELVRMHM